MHKFIGSGIGSFSSVLDFYHNNVTFSYRRNTMEGTRLCSHPKAGDVILSPSRRGEKWAIVSYFATYGYCSIMDRCYDSSAYPNGENACLYTCM